MKCRPIPGFEKLYVISRTGDVFHILDDGKFSRISPATNDEGYRTVVLYKDSHPNFKYIHNLIAAAYLPNPDNKAIANHIDGDKTHNSADNLEWADSSENTQHAYDHGLAKGGKGEKNSQSKLSKKQVARIRKSDESGAKLADLYGVSKAAVSLIRNNERW